jgi:phosphatidate cytidylyltransferase
MTNPRLAYGTVLILMLIGAVFLPATGLFALILLVGGLALWEFYRLLRAAGYLLPHKFASAAGVGFILFTGALHLYAEPAMVADLQGIYVALFILALFLRICLLPREPNPLLSLALTLLGFFYVAYLFNFFGKLVLGVPGGDGRLVLFYTVLTVKVTDIGAYYVGCAIGRHKLIPRISPAKTWEGCAGGVLAGLAISLVFWWATDGQVGPMPLRFADAVILGILLPVTGILGDLMESMLKRALDVKDSGAWMKEMGGVLDVLDSLLFAGLVMYIYMHLVIGL